MNKSDSSAPNSRDSSEDESCVLVERSENIVTIKLNRPDTRNAFNAALCDRLSSALREVASLQDVRVVILTGTGKGFSSGADLKGGITDNVRSQLLDAYAPFLMALRRMNAIVLVAVNGAAAGIGAALVAASDLAVMADDASIQLAFSRIALVPDGGLTWELTRALGSKRALRLMIEGGKLDAAQCREFGLVNEVFPAARLMHEAYVWAQRLCNLSPTCNTLTKRALQQALRSNLQDAIAYEAELQEVAVRSSDFREGVEAFLSKRSPQFTGR